MHVTRRLSELLEGHFDRLAESPITTDVTSDEIRQHLERHYTFEEPMSTEDLLVDVGEMLWNWSEHSTNPAHFGLFRPAVDVESVAAEAMVAAFNPNLATYDFSPAAHEIERRVLDLIADRFALPPGSRWANFTSGGQEANHSAVVVALTHHYPAIGTSGLRTLTAQPVFYLSEEGHHSFEKVAHVAGLGRSALRWVPANDDLEMDTDKLDRQIRRDRSAGLLPFMVVGTAGTTNAGVIDPLDRIAAIAAHHRLWFHVDAAWGGAVALVDNLRQLLTGIEKANSITCDAHKWLSVPTGSGMFFCRHPGSVQTTFGIDSAYVPAQRRPGTTNPLATSLQWSRRLIGLSLFMVFARFGIQGVAERISRQVELGEQLRRKLVGEGFELLNPTPLPVVCFTHPRIECGEINPDDVVWRLADRQIAWISATRLRNRIPALRACITNFNTDESDLDHLVAGLIGAIGELSTAKAS